MNNDLRRKGQNEISRHQKTRLSASFLTDCSTDVSTKYSWIHVSTLYHKILTSQVKKCVDPTGIEPASQISWIQLHTSDGPTLFPLLQILPENVNLCSAIDMKALKNRKRGNRREWVPVNELEDFSLNITAESLRNFAVKVAKYV